MRATGDADAAREALALWAGDPWLPDGFDWALRDLLEDRAHAERIAAAQAARPDGGTPDAAGTAPEPQRSPTVPAALTTLVGRGAELRAIEAQLAQSRVVTLLGPGGAGKTTLALDTARRQPGAIVAGSLPRPTTRCGARSPAPPRAPCG